MKAEQLLIADAYFCRVTTAPSRTENSIAELSVVAGRSFNKSDVAAPYYRTIVYYDTASSQHPGKIYGHGALKLKAARFSRNGLQMRVQKKRFDRITEHLESNTAVCRFPAAFCFCAYTNDD